MCASGVLRRARHEWKWNSNHNLFTEQVGGLIEVRVLPGECSKVGCNDQEIDVDRKSVV